MPEDENQFSTELQAALEKARREVINEIPNRVEVVSPDNPIRVDARAMPQVLRQETRLDAFVAPSQEQPEPLPIVSEPFRETVAGLEALTQSKRQDAPSRALRSLPATSALISAHSSQTSSEFGYLTDVQVPGVGHILEPGPAFRGALLQVEGLPVASPEVRDGKPEGLTDEDLGLPGAKDENDPLPEAWKFEEGDSSQKPLPGSEDVRRLDCGSDLIVTATFQVTKEVVLAKKIFEPGAVFDAAEVAEKLNEKYAWTAQDLANRETWLDRIHLKICEWGKDEWSQHWTRPTESPSIPDVTAKPNHTDGRSEEETEGEGSGAIFPPKWIKEEVVCEPRCVPHWYYLGCKTLHVKELARYYRVSPLGNAVSLLSYVTATLQFTWRVVCEELVETPEGRSLLEQGAISDNGTSLGHYRRKQWDGPVPEPSKPSEGCCCVIESIEIVNPQSFKGPLPPEGGQTKSDRWGHKFGIKIKYWYKNAEETLDCHLIWSEWTDNAPAWTGFDNQRPRWRKISELYPDSPVFDAWKTRPVTKCYDRKPTDLTEVILPVELVVAWEDKLGTQATNSKNLLIHLKATGCDDSEADLCIQQQLKAGNGNLREGWIAESDCDGKQDPTSFVKPYGAVEYGS